MRAVFLPHSSHRDGMRIDACDDLFFGKPIVRPCWFMQCRSAPTPSPGLLTGAMACIGVVPVAYERLICLLAKPRIVSKSRGYWRQLVRLCVCVLMFDAACGNSDHEKVLTRNASGRPLRWLALRLHARWQPPGRRLFSAGSRQRSRLSLCQCVTCFARLFLTT